MVAKEGDSIHIMSDEVNRSVGSDFQIQSILRQWPVALYLTNLPNLYFQMLKNSKHKIKLRDYKKYSIQKKYLKVQRSQIS